jgi:signal peptidase I
MPKAQIAATQAATASPLRTLVREYASALAWALVLAFVIRTFVVQTFEIPSGSMENTLEIGDRIIANKFLYGLRLPWSGQRLLPIRAPKRGDVVIFKFPLDRSQDFVKRLIGLPGDTILVRDKQVFVNGRLYANPHERHTDSHILSAAAGPRDNFGPVRVPQGSYFMMGDNRDESYDSRFWGFVPAEDLLGLAMVKYWSKVPDSWTIRWGSMGQVIS